MKNMKSQALFNKIAFLQKNSPLILMLSYQHITNTMAKNGSWYSIPMPPLPTVFNTRLVNTVAGKPVSNW